MTISGLKLRYLLLGAVLGAAALAPLPASAQYGGGGYGGGGYNSGGYGDDDYGGGYRRQYRPRCYYRVVRVYDDYYGRYVKRRQRVCERSGY